MVRQFSAIINEDRFARLAVYLLLFVEANRLTTTMKTFAVVLCAFLTLAVVLGQNSNMGFNMNGLNRNNWNGWNGNWNNMNNMNNWMAMNMNGMNALIGMNGMNGWMNTNMANINGGRDDAVMSEGIYDDASGVSAKPVYVTEQPLTIMAGGDGESTHAFVTPSHEDVMIVATSADDPTEGHVVVANGDNFGAYHKADV